MESTERVGLRRFAQYVAASRAQRRSLVVAHRQQVETDWSPITDPYRFLIRAVVRMHEAGSGPEVLDHVVDREHSARRRTTIRSAVGDYTAWLAGAGPVTYHPAPVADWRCEDACVRVNPEIGLEVRGQRYLIKLHFAKGSPIMPTEAAIMTAVMREALGREVPPDCRMAVLDVRSGVLHTEARGTARLVDAIRAAAADFASTWDRVN
jgi:hypothetical protein